MILPPRIRRLLWLERVVPVTHHDVESAPRDPVKEQRIRAIRGKLAKEVVDLERTSWEVRRELAGNVLRIVSGDHKHAKGTNS